MNDTGFASLSPALLARKGGAKPAMRPQNTTGATDGKTAAANLEDLGWNDMGEDVQPQGARVVRMTPAGAGASAAPSASPVRDTLDRIAAKLETPGPARVSAANKAANDSRRAAFTLRLDQERHLKLRLACTVRGRSAQQLVTDALDSLLAQMPEIDNLAAQVLREQRPAASIGEHVGAQRLELRRRHRLVGVPPDFRFNFRPSDNELVLGGPSGVLAGLHDERPAFGDHAFAALHREFIIGGGRQVPERLRRGVVKRRKGGLSRRKSRRHRRVLPRRLYAAGRVPGRRWS